MADRNFLQKLADSQLPIRVLGALLSVPVPGAGHVVIGHARLGLLIAAVSFSLWGVATIGAVHEMPWLFLLCAAAWIVVTVWSVVSIFALRPGVGMQSGLRRLGLALALFLVSRGALYLIPTYGFGIAPAPDDSLAPAIRKGDTLLVHPGSAASTGDVVLIAKPDGTHEFRRCDASTPRAQIEGRALFVFASGGGDARDRIWKSLRK